MKVFLVDRTIHENVVYSQLLMPLQCLNNKQHLLLLPETLLKKHKDDMFQFQICRYHSRLSKYRMLFRFSAIREIYTRSVFEFMSLYLLRALFLKKWNITYDFRGLAYAEYALRKKEDIKCMILKQIEKFVSHNADSIRTVSYQFADFLRQNWSVKKQIQVIPCCISEVFLVEKSFLDRPISFVYVGSMARWQRFDDLLDLYKKLAKLLKTRLTIITSDVVMAKHKLLQADIPADVISLPQQLVAQELKKHDFGFLLRENRLLNQVASPIKFLEYIGNGVIPILSEGIGDYANLCKKHGIGIIESADIQQMAQEIIRLRTDQTIQKRLYDVASQYTWKNYLNVF